MRDLEISGPILSLEEWQQAYNAIPDLNTLFDEMTRVHSDQWYRKWFEIRDKFLDKLRKESGLSETEIRAYAAFEKLVCGTPGYESHPDVDFEGDLSIAKFLTDLIEEYKQMPSANS